ncbi:hypothetical protein FS086_07475 [Campylobacter jejuni]|nr:hypothetical protein [Campylobacter jejuni]
MAYSIAFCETILAPVTPSNTARAGAIINPIVQVIARSFKSTPEDGTQNKIGTYLSLVNYQDPILFHQLCLLQLQLQILWWLSYSTSYKFRSAFNLGVIGFRDVFTWYSCYAFDAFDALFSLSARN